MKTRNLAAIPALVGLCGALLGIGAVVTLFFPSLIGLTLFFTVLAAACAASCGLIAHRMTKAVATAEDEVNKAINLLLAQTREMAVASNGQMLDTETSLPGKEFFELAVHGRIASARRHLWPISVVLVNLKLEEDILTSDKRKEGLNQFLGLMRQTLRESDVACKLGDNTFGLILEDTSEEGGVWTAERLQIALAKNNTHIHQIAAGVATYPTHALHADEILRRANTALARAAATAPPDGLGRVEVAHVDLG